MSMELRSVIKMRDSAGITLPYAWREANKIAARDQVYVEVSAAGDLLIVRPLPAAEKAEPVVTPM